MTMILLTTLLLALQTPSAQPSEDPVTGGASAKTEKPAKERKICRPDGETGSRLGGRVCRTEAEWDAIRKRATDRKNHH
jgi:hypothetical protein